MCGRYVSPEERAIEREWSRVRPLFADLRPNYNTSPTQQVPVVRDRDGELTGVTLRWGLIPFWAKGRPTKYSTINARAETVETAASYRGPWKRAQRCIFLADGFYEWQVRGSSKQPFYIRMAGGEVFGMAGLWDSSQTDDGETVESCTIITVPANPLLAEIHNKRQRMPAILTTEMADQWLQGDPGEAKALLTPYPANLMDAYPVSTRVNSPKNQGPELIEQVPA